MYCLLSHTYCQAPRKLKFENSSHLDRWYVLFEMHIFSLVTVKNKVSFGVFMKRVLVFLEGCGSGLFAHGFKKAIYICI